MKALLARGWLLAAIYICFARNIGATTGRHKSQNAVKLANIKALTFHSGKLTTSRRVDPIPQLSCVGGSAQGLYEPESIRCRNSGSSYSSAEVEWTCQASLPPEFRLGGTEVVCEGFDNAEDDHILKGSCGLEYRLLLTDLGEEKFGRKWFKAADRAGSWFGGRTSDKYNRRGVDLEGLIFGVVFFSVLCWMVYAAFFRDRARYPTPPRRPAPNGYGGADDNDDDPPPPYDPRPPSGSYGYTKPSSSGARFYRNPNPGQRAPNRGWRPGFWTGLGTGLTAGAAAGNAYGRFRNRQEADSMPGRAGGIFGGGPARTSSSGGQAEGRGIGSSPSYSSERYTSTGFGGTRRT